MILWLKRYRKQKIRNIILYFVVLSIFVWKIGYDLDSQMHPEGRSMTVRFAFYVQKWPIHKEKLTLRKMLQMAAEKRFLKGVYMSIRVLFICYGRIYRAWWKVSYRLISPVFKRFLCFNLKFTNDLPIFLESQTCKKMSQNEEIKTWANWNQE